MREIDKLAQRLADLATGAYGCSLVVDECDGETAWQEMPAPDLQRWRRAVREAFGIGLDDMPAMEHYLDKWENPDVLAEWLYDNGLRADRDWSNRIGAPQG